MQKNKRSSISMQDKLSILKEIESGNKPNDICKKYSIHASTLSRIKINKENIHTFVSNNLKATTLMKRMKGAQNSELEKRLYAWFVDRRSMHDIITNDVLKLKALDINKSMNGSDDFIASDGWLTKFKKRFNLRILKISGEKLSCNTESAILFINDFKKIILENEFVQEQIYNCDETGLVYKSLHNKTNVAYFEKSAAGRKLMKERVTIMPCTNATGTHKLELMMIGKSKSPRCFKNSDIPLHYKSSKNAWQTTALFLDWFKTVFIPQVTLHLQSKNLPVKAILLLDNATCHGTETLLNVDSRFKVIFFPPNNTPLLQPLDQNVIKSFKQRYRKNLLIELASLSDGKESIVSALKKINLKDVTYLTVHAWLDVPQTVIQNSFKHLFHSIEDNQGNKSTECLIEDNLDPLPKLYQSIFGESVITDDEILDWAEGSHDTTMKSITETDDEELNEMGDDKKELINNVISSFNTVIEWCENNNIPINEMILLRRIREKAVVKKYSINC